jgi:hypothetical protein
MAKPACRLHEEGKACGPDEVHAVARVDQLELQLIGFNLNREAVGVSPRWGTAA